MSQSGSKADGVSRANFYPSPPTSPKSLKVADKSAPSKRITKSEAKSSIDLTETANSPEKPTEYDRPVTPAESTTGEKEDGSESTKEAEELDTWKAALSLSDMTCGATRKDKMSCENKISAKKMQSIDDIVKLVKGLPSNSSLEIETHLDNLAKIAHCHYHDHPPSREARVSHWMTVLPGARPVPSPQTRLRTILGPAPAKCTSVKKDGKPCNNRIGSDRRFHIKQTTNEMINWAMEPKEKDHHLAVLAKVLEHYMFCDVHQKYCYGQQDDWKRLVNKFRAACQQERNVSSRLVEGHTATAQEGNIHADRSTLTSPPLSPEGQLLMDNPRAYWDTGYETSRFRILGKNDMVDEEKSIVDEIRDTARELLNTDANRSRNEVNSGFIYLYQVPGNDAFVKIGFTGDVTKRLEEWKKDCHREPVLYPLPAAAVAVPHAHRVERLIHAELREHRVRLYCERCEKQHNEWFETSVDRAAAVIEKWLLWMRGRPYEERKTRSEVKWYLKEAEAKRLADVPQFLEGLEKAAKAAKASE
ncbi:Putative helicase A859L [Cordyceps militaris CM01]|uniref:Putative helicase A859L n=1 Tax=Cordyceps militaris (strain CM01) TaxID=983644 RepID=G3JTV2_CORMM|nr:Putative helicase A859L [Cordyceps militaris CM01]EGX88106.1 Putative helicase A859L [Cordyceps militaris CM01]